MMIERLQVQNYKSLKDLDITLKPLTVLVGPNAAGKSNIIDCVSFLTEVLLGNLEVALKKRGSFSDVVWGGEEGRNVSISLKWKPASRKAASFSYTIEFGMEQAPPPIIREESAYVVDASGKEFAIQRHGMSFKSETTTGSIGGFDSALRYLGGKTPLPEMLGSWCFYDFLPSRMRAPQAVAKQTRLLADGGNTATLLHWLHSEEPEVFQRVEQHLKHAIPEVDRLLSPLTEDGKTYVAWREKVVPGRIPAWNMSEGSVRLVAVLLALLVPDAPPLVALETPEIHLHSYLMEYLAEILKIGSQRTQVIITTHSTHFLNYVSPQDVLIVKKQDGQTKVEPVEDSKALAETLKTLGLGEVYYAGHIGGVP